MNLYVIGGCVLTLAALVFGVLAYPQWRANRAMKALESKYTRPPIHAGEPNFERDAKLVRYSVAERTRSIALSYAQKLNIDEPDSPVGKVEVADILYNNDETQMVALVGYEEPRLRRGQSNPYEVTACGSAYAGIRENRSSPWLLYPLQVSHFYGFDSATEAATAVQVEHFEFITDRATMAVGTSIRTSEPLYNVGDPRFWTSALWEKGNRVPDLYPFQVRNGVANRDPSWVPVRPLVDAYPEWILEMYRDG